MMSSGAAGVAERWSRKRHTPPCELVTCSSDIQLWMDGKSEEDKKTQLNESLVLWWIFKDAIPKQHSKQHNGMHT